MTPDTRHTGRGGQLVLLGAEVANERLELRVEILLAAADLLQGLGNVALELVQLHLQG